MAFKIDEIMDMSLDDYIAVSKKSSVTTTNGNNINQANYTKVSNDVKFGRRKGNIDDEEEDEELLYIKETKEEPIGRSTPLNEDTGIWKAPDSSIDYLDCHVEHNDLRDKLNNSNQSNNHNRNNRHGQLTTVQYRLMAPNNFSNRPRGIPTLLPLDAYVRQQPNNGRRRNRNRGGNNYNNNNNRGGGGRGCNSNGNNTNNNNYANGGSGGGGGYITNGRVQKNRPNEMVSKNLRISLNPNDINFNDINTSKRNLANDLNSSFHLPQSNGGGINNDGTQSVSIGNLTPQAQAVLNLNSNTNQQTVAGSLKNILGFQGDLTGDMMPLFASRLLEFAGQPNVHKPIYDMKVQKDICEIQNKPLLYKCPGGGGEVVSSDGAGVNCKIIPRTSGVSLNCRFA